MVSSSSTGDVTATAVAPLTTKFNPAPSCLEDLYLEVTAAPFGPSIPGGYSWVHLGPTTSKAACVPSGWAPNAYYSPGICPASYTLGCDASTHTIGKSTTEYRATCCPTGYACRDPGDTSLYPWATIDLCTVRDLTTTTAIVTYSTATLALGVTNYFQALGVSIRWQSGDSLPVQTGPPISTAIKTTTASATTSTATTTTISHSISTTSTTSTTSHKTSATESSLSLAAPPASTETHSSLPVSESSTSSGGLSTGAKAGVGVGVAIAGILIIFAAVFFFYIRPRRNKNLSQNAWNGEKKTELEAMARVPVHPSHELASLAINELEGSNRHIVHELDTPSNGGRK